MGRTPLLRALRTLFAEHRAARQLGLPVEAIRERRARAAEERARRGLTRRQLLAGAGAAAALITRPRRARAAAGPTIAIVGGGIAGLACALELADRGIAATVYEASGRVGGRMFSNTGGYWDAGQVTEWGGELIDSGHRTVRRLARRFDLKLDDLLAAQPNHSDDVYRFFGHYYPKSQADADFSASYDRIAADEAAAPFPSTWDSHTEEGESLDNMSVFDYIEDRVPDGHESPLGQLLDTAYTIEYGADSEDQSALNLLYLLAFQPSPHELAVFGESDEKFHIRGGNQQLPKAMAAALARDGQDRPQAREDPGDRRRPLPPVVRARLGHGRGRRRLGGPGRAVRRPRDGRLRRRRLRRAKARGDRRAGSRPQREAPGAAPPTPLARCRPVAGQGQRLELQRHGLPGVVGGHARPGRRPGILVLYSGGSVTDAMRTTQPFATATDAKVRDDAKTGLVQLAPVFAGLDWNGKATQSLPHKSPFFRASYSFYKPGQYTTFGGYEAVRQGGVLFAGEHTSTDFQGFMEGGAEQGQRAAGELADLI